MARPPLAPSTATPDPYTENRGVEENNEDDSSAPAADVYFGALTATAPSVIAFAGAATVTSRFSFGDAPSLSVMSLSNKGNAAKSLASAPDLSFGAASLLSATTPVPCRLSPWHQPRPSHLAPECHDHAAEVAEHPNPLPDILHHHIKNSGGQRITLVMYGENTKARERTSYRSSNPK